VFYVSPNAERLSDGRKRAWVSESMGNHPNVLSSVHEQHELEILQNSGKLTIHKGRFFGRKSSKLKTCSRGSVNGGKKGSVNGDEILYVGELEALAWYRWKVSENRDVVI